MAINIQSLFADIISTPEQREDKLLKEGMLQGQLLASGLKGRVANLAPLAQIAGQLGVQRQENLKRAVQPMLGIDPRTTGERIEEAVSGLDMSTPEGLQKAALAIQSVDPLRAATLRQAAVEMSQANKEKNKKQSYRDLVADEAVSSTRFGGFSEAIREGVLPDDQINNIYTEITKEKEVEDKSPIQLLKPDGTASTALVDKQGNFYNLSGSPIDLEEGTRALKGSLTGSPDQFTSSERTFLRTAQGTVGSFVSQANNIINAVTENPNVNTAVGKLSSVFNNIAQEADAALSLVNPDFNRGSFLKKNKLGQQTAEMQSMLFAVTFEAAKAVADQQGRAVTEKDVERFMTIVGADSADSEVLIANLERIKRQLVGEFKSAYQITYGVPFEGRFEPVQPQANNKKPPGVPEGKPDPSL